MTVSSDHISNSDMDAVREQAAYWVLEAQSGDPESQQAFENWIQQDPLHQTVFKQMEQLWLAVDPTEQQQKIRTKRKRITAGVSLCLLGCAVSLYLPWNYWQADFRTPIGEIETVQLSDGSKVVLNTNSAINVSYKGSQRTVELVRGEALFIVNKDQQQRRFNVLSKHANAVALGTAYTVAVDEHHSLVTVYESEVNVLNRQSYGEATLVAGQRIKVGEQVFDKTTVALADYPDWSEGQLVFNRAPLKEVLKSLNAYRPGYIHLMDANDQRLFTGVLPAEDPETAMRLLAEAMNLSAQQLTPYFVVLQRKDKK